MRPARREQAQRGDGKHNSTANGRHSTHAQREPKQFKIDREISPPRWLTRNRIRSHTVTRSAHLRAVHRRIQTRTPPASSLSSTGSRADTIDARSRPSPSASTAQRGPPRVAVAEPLGRGSEASCATDARGAAAAVSAGAAVLSRRALCFPCPLLSRRIFERPLPSLTRTVCSDERLDSEPTRRAGPPRLSSARQRSATRRTARRTTMSNFKMINDEGGVASRTHGQSRRRPRDDEDEEKQTAAQPSAHVSPATRIYRHALEFIFGMLTLDDLTRILAVSRSWSAAVRSRRLFTRRLNATRPAD